MNEIEVIEKESNEIIVKAQNIVIADQEQYENAAGFLKLIKGMQKKVGDSFNSIIEKAHQAHKEAIAKRDEHLNPLVKAEKELKVSMANYVSKKEEEARAEQKRLQDLADAEAEKQRKALEKKIEKAEASGNTEKVEALQEKKENIQPIVAPVIAPKIETPKGVSYRDKYTAEVIDFALLPNEYKIANQSMLDKVAQSTKGSIPIPGVKFNVEKIPAVRA